MADCLDINVLKLEATVSSDVPDGIGVGVEET